MKLQPREKVLAILLSVIAVSFAVRGTVVGLRQKWRDIGMVHWGSGYASRLIGSSLSHSSGHVSLFKQVADGEWVLLWHSVSRRLESRFTWQDKIVFGAATQYRIGEDPLPIRVLLYQRSNGALVDITEPLNRLAGIPGKQVYDIKVKRDGQLVHWEYQYWSKSHEFTTTLDQLCDFAREVKYRGRLRVFDEFGVWEERE